MSEFDFFEKVITENIQNAPEKSTSVSIKVHTENPWKPECEHNSIHTESNTTICMDCGIEIDSHKFNDKDWKYYDEGKSAARCQVKKEQDKSIYKDVEGKGIPEKVITIADKLYLEVTKGGIHRKINRTSIIFACVYEAYKQSGIPQDFEKLVKAFYLERKPALSGIKYIAFRVPKDMYAAPEYTNVTPVTLIKNIMEMFFGTEKQIEQVVEIYHKIKKGSKVITGCKPNSLASSVVYYWIKNYNGNNITLKNFALKVKLSEITIKKICKNIETVMENK